MNFVEVEDVVKQFSGHRALDGVSLRVPEGCVYGLLGPNGAGKTTLIRILNHIIAPDSGRVRLQGRPSTAADVRQIGYLPEERGLYRKMRVADYIVYIGRLKGMSRADAASETSRWLSRFDLAGWRGKKIDTLSKGMAQRVQFIATVIHRPRLLIFDEPFSGFDPVGAQQLKGEIAGLKDAGATVIFSTHNMESVEEVCERVTMLDRARVVLEGAVAEIRRAHSRNVYAVDLPGDERLDPVEGLYDVVGRAVPSQTGARAEIRLCPGADLRAAIAHINSRHNLRGFSEILPKMQEIFIDTAAAGKKSRQS